MNVIEATSAIWTTHRMTSIWQSIIGVFPYWKYFPWQPGSSSKYIPPILSAMLWGIVILPFRILILDVQPCIHDCMNIPDYFISVYDSTWLEFRVASSTWQSFRQRSWCQRVLLPLLPGCSCHHLQIWRGYANGANRWSLNISTKNVEPKTLWNNLNTW